MYWADELAFRSGAQPSVTPPAAPPLKHQWKLDAVPSMTDTPANGASAASGQTTGVSVGSDSTGTYYVFSPSLSPIGEVVDHVASNPPEPIDDLDPGSADFAVTIRVNARGTAIKSCNVVQKGKNDAAIPNWKVEVGGEKSQWDRTVTCVFGSTATQRIRLRSTAKVKDRSWSTITCQRSGSDYWVTVADFDGSTPGQAKSKVKHDTKSRTIANDEPLHLGTKQAGDSDTFEGFLDDLRFSR